MEVISPRPVCFPTPISSRWEVGVGKQTAVESALRLMPKSSTSSLCACCFGPCCRSCCPRCCPPKTPPTTLPTTGATTGAPLVAASFRWLLRPKCEIHFFVFFLRSLQNFSFGRSNSHLNKHDRLHTREVAPEKGQTTLHRDTPSRMQREKPARTPYRARLRLCPGAPSKRANHMKSLVRRLSA